MSPHEMSSARIEEDLEWMREELASASGRDKQWWSGRVKNFEALLKERAENGTY
jgi:hypothetical protein